MTREVTAAIYHQSTGEFIVLAPVDDGGIERVLFQALGYAGRGHGRNNPDAEDQKNIGPLPRGRYHVSLPFHHDRKGPKVFRLRQLDGETYGRSGFLIHGDNTKGDASEGCIILDRNARTRLALYGVRGLTVLR